jgi:hypothetical protein
VKAIKKEAISIDNFLQNVDKGKREALSHLPLSLFDWDGREKG